MPETMLGGEDYSYETDEFWGAFRQYLIDTKPGGNLFGARWKTDADVDAFLAGSPESVRGALTGTFGEFSPYQDFLKRWKAKAQPPTLSPDLTDELLQRARKAQLFKLQSGNGRRGTFLTGPMGDFTTLLGG